MNIWILLIIVLLVLAIGGAPGWGYHKLGYTPSISVGGILLVLLILYLLGVIR